MTQTAWRICKRRYAGAMWSGVGSRSVAGRWHSKGALVVYTSGSLALAAVELLVHLDSTEILRNHFVKCSVEFDRKLCDVLPIADLPRNWRADPLPFSLRAIGDEWVAAARSAILAVPSVLVPQEWNYLINPAHQDFKKLTFGTVTSFKYDPRLA